MQHVRLRRNGAAQLRQETTDAQRDGKLGILGSALGYRLTGILRVATPQRAYAKIHFLQLVVQSRVDGRLFTVDEAAKGGDQLNRFLSIRHPPHRHLTDGLLCARRRANANPNHDVVARSAILEKRLKVVVHSRRQINHVKCLRLRETQNATTVLIRTAVCGRWLNRA